MEAYSIAVTVHIICATLWVGGGMALLLGAELARRKFGSAGALPVIDVVALLGPVYFVPVSLLALISGIAAAWIGPGFSELWVILGLFGFAATFATGMLLVLRHKRPIRGSPERGLRTCRTDRGRGRTCRPGDRGADAGPA